MMASGKITDYFGIEGGRQTVLRWFQKFLEFFFFENTKTNMTIIQSTLRAAKKSRN